MEQTKNILALKFRTQKPRKKDSSSSSSSSLGASANMVDLPEPSLGHRYQINDALLTMGHAMEHAVMGDGEEDKNHKHKHKHKHKRHESPPSDMPTTPLLLQQGSPSLDFLHRRKLAAALMRIQNESEKPVVHHLLDMHYMPSVLQDATMINRNRFQAAKAWAKAQERISEMKVNKARRKIERDSILNDGRRFVKKMWKFLDKHSYHFTQFKFWARDLKWMECSFGSSMMITFVFLRWVFLLNLFLGIIWFCTIVLPFLLTPPEYFDWAVFKTAFDKKNIWLALQGIGIDKSFIFYGGYDYIKNEQIGWYHTDYMYPLTIVGTILISVLAVLCRITVRILQTGSKTIGSSSGNVLYPFATLTFATWDFHVTSFEGATIMRRGIRMQLRERLADDKNKKDESKDKPATLIKRYTALFVLWPMLLAASAGCEYYLVNYGDEISDRIGVYADSVLICLVNSASPRMVKTLVQMEDWKPATHERVTIIKLYFLRILNLSTILYRSYLVLTSSWRSLEGKEVKQTCQKLEDCNDAFICCTSTNMGEWHLCTSKEVGHCVAGCAENWVASELMGMIAITTLVNIGISIAIGLFSILWYGTKWTLDITDFVVDIVYMQALVWITSCYSPLACLAGCFSNFITFVSYKNVLFYTCKPVQNPYSASRTSNLTYGMLLATLLFSIVPIAVQFSTASAAFCGPIHDHISMYEVLNNYIKKAPKEFNKALDILSNPWLQWTAILGLILSLVVMQAKLKQCNIFANLTKRELEMSRRILIHDGLADYERLSVEDDVGILIPH